MPSITTKTATAFTGHKWALALTRIPVVSKEGVEAYNYPIVSMAFPVTTGGAILMTLLKVTFLLPTLLLTLTRTLDTSPSLIVEVRVELLPL